MRRVSVFLTKKGGGKQAKQAKQAKQNRRKNPARLICERVGDVARGTREERQLAEECKVLLQQGKRSFPMVVDCRQECKVATRIFQQEVILAAKLMARYLSGRVYVYYSKHCFSGVPWTGAHEGAHEDDRSQKSLK